jgi:hypothetical protein
MRAVAPPGELRRLREAVARLAAGTDPAARLVAEALQEVYGFSEPAGEEAEDGWGGCRRSHPFFENGYFGDTDDETAVVSSTEVTRWGSFLPI